MRFVFILLMLAGFSMTACGEPEMPQKGVSIIPTAPVADPTFTSLPRATREGYLATSTPLDTRSNSMNDDYQLLSAQENRLYLLYNAVCKFFSG